MSLIKKDVDKFRKLIENKPMMDLLVYRELIDRKIKSQIREYGCI